MTLCVYIYEHTTEPTKREQKKRNREMDIIKVLPEECISLIISYTSPRDACRTSLVSHGFQSVADSDAVWERFLPSDYQEIISSTPSQVDLLSLSKKKLYLHLCDNPLLIENGTASFSLEKENGKKQYMIAARGLSIAWGNTPSYWTWETLPESRFTEVARLKYVWWLEVKGRIEASVLSPETTYAAYFVFKLADYRRGFEEKPVEMNVNIDEDVGGSRWSAILDPPENEPQVSMQRGDGWMEIGMGKFFNGNENHGSTVVCSLREVDSFCTKHGLIIEGIEFRPEEA